MNAMIGYHSTSKKQYRRIIANGFLPLKYADKGIKRRKKPKTWFTTYPQFMYGDYCIEVNLTDLDVTGDSDIKVCWNHEIGKERILSVLK